MESSKAKKRKQKKKQRPLILPVIDEQQALNRCFRESPCSRLLAGGICKACKKRTYYEVLMNGKKVKKRKVMDQCQLIHFVEHCPGGRTL
jgi:hypothetical protein